MSLDELLADLAKPQMPVERDYTRTLIQAKMAEGQNDTAKKSLWWARLAVAISAGATRIALVALVLNA